MVAATAVGWGDGGAGEAVLSGLSVVGSGAAVAGGADAMDGGGEGCDPVAVVVMLGAGDVGSIGAGCWCGGGTCGESLMASWGCDGGGGKGCVTGGKAE